MGLDFTSIEDKSGAAVYFIHSGNHRDERLFSKLMEEVSSRTKKQCVLMSIKEDDGRKIIDFYHLKGTHFVVIVRDNDQLHHVWSDGEHFDPSAIAHLANQAG